MTSWLSFLKSSRLKHCEILLSSFAWFQFLVTLLITHSSSASQDCPQRSSLMVLMIDEAGCLYRVLLWTPNFLLQAYMAPWGQCCVHASLYREPVTSESVLCLHSRTHLFSVGFQMSCNRSLITYNTLADCVHQRLSENYQYDTTHHQSYDKTYQCDTRTSIHH